MVLELIRALGLPAAILLFAAAILLYRRIYRFTHRPPDQVIAYLRAVDPGEVRHLLDPVAEHYLRLNLTKRQFHNEQRQRLWLALEFLQRMAHNALVMAEWGSYELKRTHRTLNEEDRQASLELLAAAVHVRLCSFVLRTRIHAWLARMALLPFLPPPSVAKLASVGSTELFEFYDKMRLTASRLSHSYGERYHGAMAEALRVEAAG